MKSVCTQKTIMAHHTASKSPWHFMYIKTENWSDCYSDSICAVSGPVSHISFSIEAWQTS